MNKFLILVVEDDAPVRNLITTTLKAHDYRFIIAANGNTAVMETASHNPDIILLDEPTSNVDSINEGIILKASKEQKCKKSIILVSHRESTMAIADRIYRVSDGKMQEVTI